ncbi:MAG TPA: hypothetical protein VH480_02210 [Streptosporangiaceae bacterium]
MHSIEELAQLARARLGQQPGGFPPGGAPSQPGYAAQPQPGYSETPGYAQQPQPGYSEGNVPGYAQQPRPGPPGGWQGRRPNMGGRSGSGMDFNTGDIADDIAGAVLGAAAGAAAKFIGRSIGKKMQNAYQQKVVPALAAKQEEMLRAQIAIAERHPDVRACLNDNVIFLAGGSRVLPMPNLQTLTVEQADNLVAQLRNG